jgi:hypothetical protein
VLMTTTGFVSVFPLYLGQQFFLVKCIWTAQKIFVSCR